jgi:hypothetical protein
MTKRIELLKDRLPEFLVKNKKLYWILSLGIHELDEADCLGFFSVIRGSTIYILEEINGKKKSWLKGRRLRGRSRNSFIRRRAEPVKVLSAFPHPIWPAV